MSWNGFHNPNISWPVVRRRAGTEFLELLELSSRFLSRGGWAVLNRSSHASETAYRAAKSRLKKQGLIAAKSEGGKAPQLTLTAAGQEVIPAYFAPEAYWNRPWNRIWYLLVYDVPEVDRKYRGVLRAFLKRRRLGCLQQSVWITPEDLRPAFDDLAQAANIEAFAFLFEAKTVLNLPTNQIVNTAWNMDRLYELHDHYITVTEKNHALLQSAAWSPPDLAELLQISVDAYHAAMATDPLLPDALLPSNYLGKRVFEVHRALMDEVNQQCACYI